MPLFIFLSLEKELEKSSGGKITLKCFPCDKKNLDLIYEGLLKGKLSFVGLDVLPDEPPSNNEKLIQAWKDPNHKLFNRIIINPHSAYYSQKAWFEMRSKSADNILNVLLGGRPRNLIS